MGHACHSASRVRSPRKPGARRPARPDTRPRPGPDRGVGQRRAPARHDPAPGRGRRPLPLPDLPTIPGREVAGVVDELGEGVDGAWRGRRVVAHLGMVPGGYAEQAVTDVGSLYAVPPGLTDAEAVAAVGMGRTPRDLRPGTADGGRRRLRAVGGRRVGWLLAQAARDDRRHRGGGGGGADRTAKLRELGADLVVDYGRRTGSGRCGTGSAA